VIEEPPESVPTHHSEVLTSWKEIAFFFGVSVRTVQLWETERNLPVYRMPGAKGRVYAITGELHSWRHGVLHVVEPDTTVPAPAVVARRRRPRWVLTGAAVLVLLVAGGWALWRWRHPAGVPERWHLAGNTLEAIDHDGAVLWRYSFESEPNNDHLGEDDATGPLIEDLDGDGRPELIFPFRTANLGSANDALFCFSPDGTLLWRHTVGRAVHSRKEAFELPYRIRQLAVVPVKGSRRKDVVYTASHKVLYATQVALRDAEGRLLREYWHSGHFTSLLVADIDGDARAEIYLTGVANGYRCADLVKLDPERFAGASVETEADYQILDRPPVAGELRILFGRTRLGQLLDRYNVGRHLRKDGNSVMVLVREGETSGTPGSLLYRLDGRLRVVGVQPDDALTVSYRRFKITGGLKEDWSGEELDALSRPQLVTPAK